jgi:plastocyanin
MSVRHVTLRALHDLSAAFALAACALLASACGGGDGGGTTTPRVDGPPAAVSVTLPATTLAIGDSARATAVVRDAAGHVLSGVAVTWSSSATNIASVNASTGLMRGLALGDAQISATAAGGSAPRAASSLTVRAPAAVTVSMFPNAFAPVSFLLAVGGVVTYDFPPGIDHNVIFPKRANGQPLVVGSPNDILQTRNARVTRTFATAGTFTFDCTIHPGMTGEVIVVP